MEGRSTVSALVGDIGGTKALLAIVETTGVSFRWLHEQRFPSRQYPSLAPIVNEFLASLDGTPETACFGVPGAVIDGECRTPNLPWWLSEEEVAEATGIRRVAFINDFAAAAAGVLAVAPADLVTMQPGRHQSHGTKVVLGAGTGLGQAVLVWGGDRYTVLPSEAGHADFAPQGDEQRALQRYLELSEDRHICVEDVLSGSGLARVYRFLVSEGVPTSPEVARAMQDEDAAAVISRFALAESDLACQRAVDIFVAVYGAEAGNLALRSLPYGGLYVAGGIAPKIRPRLEDGAFLSAFHRKGGQTELMDDFPVHLVLDARLGLLGAALTARELAR